MPSESPVPALQAPENSTANGADGAMGRRHWLGAAALATAGLGTTGAVSTTRAAETAATEGQSFRFCLNTSTIRGQELPLVEEIEITAKAGYDGIEPWIRKIRQYEMEGGSLDDLRKRLEDHGLSVDSAIGFAKWIVDDESQRAAGLEEAKRDMDLVARLGGTHIAAPPAGATKEAGLDLFEAAKRYRALLEVGDQTGVIPMVEVWGFSANLSRLGESIFVAIEAGHDKACLLGDVYHIYKGGSDYDGLGMLSASALPCFHMNDYPADPPRAEIKDEHRVFPGDGVAPIGEILSLFKRSGAFPSLSLELFNRDYWKRPPLDVAKEGLEKMKAVTASVA